MAVTLTLDDVDRLRGRRRWTAGQIAFAVAPARVRAALPGRLGVTASTLARILRDGTLVFDHAERLGRLLGCSPAAFLPRKPNPLSPFPGRSKLAKAGGTGE